MTDEKHIYRLFMYRVGNKYIAQFDRAYPDGKCAGINSYRLTYQAMKRLIGRVRKTNHSIKRSGSGGWLSVSNFWWLT